MPYKYMYIVQIFVNVLPWLAASEPVQFQLSEESLPPIAPNSHLLAKARDDRTNFAMID